MSEQSKDPFVELYVSLSSEDRRFGTPSVVAYQMLSGGKILNVTVWRQVPVRLLALDKLDAVTLIKLQTMKKLEEHDHIAYEDLAVNYLGADRRRQMLHIVAKIDGHHCAFLPEEANISKILAYGEIVRFAVKRRVGLLLKVDMHDPAFDPQSIWPPFFVGHAPYSDTNKG